MKRKCGRSCARSTSCGRREDCNHSPRGGRSSATVCSVFASSVALKCGHGAPRSRRRALRSGHTRWPLRSRLHRWPRRCRSGASPWTPAGPTAGPNDGDGGDASVSPSGRPQVAMPAAKYMMPFWCGGSRCRAAVRCGCCGAWPGTGIPDAARIRETRAACSAERQPRAWAAATSASSMRCAR
jgi:hypothetical protein